MKSRRQSGVEEGLPRVGRGFGDRSPAPRVAAPRERALTRFGKCPVCPGCHEEETERSHPPSLKPRRTGEALLHGAGAPASSTAGTSICVAQLHAKDPRWSPVSTRPAPKVIRATTGMKRLRWKPSIPSLLERGLRITTSAFPEVCGKRLLAFARYCRALGRPRFNPN